MANGGGLFVGGHTWYFYKEEPNRIMRAIGSGIRWIDKYKGAFTVDVPAVLPPAAVSNMHTAMEAIRTDLTWVRDTGNPTLSQADFDSIAGALEKYVDSYVGVPGQRSSVPHPLPAALVTGLVEVFNLLGAGVVPANGAPVVKAEHPRAEKLSRLMMGLLEHVSGEPRGEEGQT